MALAHIQGHRVVWFLYILHMCMMLVRFYVLFVLVCGGKKGREHNLMVTGTGVLCLISVVNLLKPEQFVVDF